MSTMTIVVCTPDQAEVIQERMIQDGFHIDLRDSMDMVFWDATAANPADPEMIFRNHAVLIGSRG
jgi:hypothetical protein